MKLPKILWHYTTAAGLYGIVTTGTLRLTDIRFLNDKMEAHYGAARLREIVGGTFGEGLVASAMNRWLDHGSGANALYVASFSEIDDSLSQWQRYGNDGFGYCLGFDFHALRDAPRAPQALLTRMLYEESEQCNAVRDQISELVRELEPDMVDERAGAEPGDFVETAAGYAMTVLETTMQALKNPVFSDEREWRLVYSKRPHSVGLRSRQVFTMPWGHYIKPYAELRFVDAQAHARPLPIVAITCGPRLDRSLAEIGARELLTFADYPESVRVSLSRLSSSWR